MIHNVLARQLPLDAGRVTGGARGGRDRPRPPARRRSRSGSGSALLEALGADRRRTGRGRRDERRPDRDRTRCRRLSPVVRLAPGQAQPDARGRSGVAPTATTTLHSVFVPLGARRPAQPRTGRRRPRHAPRRRRSTPARRPTTSCCGRWPRRAPRSVAAGRAGPGRRRRSRPGSRSGSRSRRGSPAARPTPPRRSTARSRRGAPSSTTSRRRVAAARLGSDVPFFLAGGPALVEGRGERVAPLRGLHGVAGRRCSSRRAVAVPTPDVFAAFDAIRGSRRRRRPDVVGAPRRGAALRARPPRTSSRGRASSPSANDLLAGRPRWSCPALVPFARAEPAARPAGRAVGLRPDPLGALCLREREAEAAAEVVRAALRDGDDRRRPARPRRSSAPRPSLGHASRGGRAMTRHADLDHRRAGRRSGRTARASSADGLVFCAGPGRASIRRPATLVEGGSRPRRERVLAEPRPPSSTRPAAPGATSSRRRSSSSTWPTSRPSTRSTAGSSPIRHRRARRSPSRPCRRGRRVEIEVDRPRSVDTPTRPPLRCPDPVDDS